MHSIGYIKAECPSGPPDISCLGLKWELSPLIRDGGRVLTAHKVFPCSVEERENPTYIELSSEQQGTKSCLIEENSFLILDGSWNIWREERIENVLAMEWEVGDLEFVIKRGSADVLGSMHREAVLTRRVTLAGQTRGLQRRSWGGLWKPDWGVWMEMVLVKPQEGFLRWCPGLPSALVLGSSEVLGVGGG